MFMASILVGIVAGLVSFFAGLIAGQGLGLAFGLYILGGLAGMALMLALAGLRHMARGRGAEPLVLSTAQG